MDLTVALDCYTICFPLLCCGKYLLSTKEAWEIALSTVKEYIGSKDFQINAIFSTDSKHRYEIGKKMLKEIEDDEFITGNANPELNNNNFINTNLQKNKHKPLFDTSDVLKYNIIEIRKCIENLCKIRKIEEDTSCDISFPIYPIEIDIAVEYIANDDDFYENFIYIKDMPYTQMNYKQIETMGSYIKRGEHWVT